MDSTAAAESRFSLLDAFKAQDLASVAAMVPAIVALAVIYSKDPTTRPFSVYDATISYPYKSGNTIPYWVVLFVGVVILLLSFALGELAARQRLGASTTAAVASFLHFVVDVLCAWIINALLTNVFKLVVGEYRPDWLDRCQPAVPEAIKVAFGAAASANPACTSKLSASALKDGHQAFPSGHASTAFVFGVYGAVYCIWAAFWRPARRYAAEAGQKRSWKERAVEDITSTAVFYWALLQLAWAWGVSVSRLVDSKHAAGDIACGALLGATVGLAFVLRAIPRHYRLMPAPKPSAQRPLLSHGGEDMPPTSLAHELPA